MTFKLWIMNYELGGWLFFKKIIKIGQTKEIYFSENKYQAGIDGGD